tara:strand:- start:474 stop:725 length:252 start_codon:yes stop_codon:yes gene_type:complete
MNNNKKLLSEFKIDYLDSVPFRDGYLVLEYVEGYEYPRYHIYYEIDDVEEEGMSDSEIIVELDSRFFDTNMANTIMQYLKTRE